MSEVELEEYYDDEIVDEYSDDDDRLAELDSGVPLDEISQKTVDKIVEKMLIVVDELSGNPLYPYQRPLAARIIESLIINDGASITALFSRQCLDGDTVVFRQDGTAVRLRNHEKAFKTGVKPTKRYKIRGGGEVIMTDNHPVRTPDGWVAAGFLKPGDYISVAQGVAQWPGINKIDRTIYVGRHNTPRHVIEDVDEDFARFLGYMTTDGSIRHGQSIKFTNNRDVYLDEMSAIVRRRWGIEAKRYRKGNGFDLLFTSTKSSYDNPILDALHAIEWDHGFPLDVFRWSADMACEFVNRAWSGDGCITMKKSGPDIFLACGNDEIYARYWHALLLKFGVMSTVKPERHAKGTSTFYRLVVGNGARNVRRFFQAFGLIYGKEQQSIDAIDYFALKALRPNGKGRAERKVYKEHGYGPDNEYLVWAKIIDIEDAGEREVFDMTVDGKGWFIANGVQVSNSGKSETVANTVAAVMIMFPVLAKVYPNLMGRFSKGVWVGAFAPVDDQADNLFGRIVSRLTSDRAIALMNDPDIQDGIKARGRTVTLKSGSLVRKQTCHPRAIIEGRTYHLILVDEAQGADDRMVLKSIVPMAASTNGTFVFTGTPTYTRNFFYDFIRKNRIEQAQKGKRQNHFEADYREASKYNPSYAKHCQQQIRNLGYDSDDFKLSYRLVWLLEQGMFTTSEVLETLGDRSMELVRAWHRSPVVVGIDPARKQDSTVVTVVWVDWDNPDEFGYMEHRILNWLDLRGVDWETQYFRIVDFLKDYNVHQIGIDVGGVGDAVASRLKVLMPHAEIIEMGSQRSDQSKRWKHLMQLINRRKLVWPAHSRVRRTRVYSRFIEQMRNLEVEYVGPYMLAKAPDISGAYDDYCDSLALACALTAEHQMPEVEVTTNLFYS